MKGVDLHLVSPKVTNNNTNIHIKNTHRLYDLNTFKNWIATIPKHTFPYSCNTSHKNNL